MWSRLLVWLKRIGLGVYVAAAIIFAVLVACVRMFFLGKAEADAEREVEAAIDEARKVKAAGKRGDADAVLDSFRRSTDKKERR